MAAVTFSPSLLKKHFPGAAIGMLVLTPLLYQCFGPSFSFLRGTLLTIFLLYITIFDLYYQLIFDRVLWAMLACGLLFLISPDAPALWGTLAAACIFSGFLLLLRLITRGGMGGGDIKLAFVLGIWLGPLPTLVAALSAFWLGGLAAFLLLVFTRAGRKAKIPFGPFLAAGAFIACLYAFKLAALYGSIFYG